MQVGAPANAGPVRMSSDRDASCTYGFPLATDCGAPSRQPTRFPRIADRMPCAAGIAQAWFRNSGPWFVILGFLGDISLALPMI